MKRVLTATATLLLTLFIPGGTLAANHSDHIIAGARTSFRSALFVAPSTVGVGQLVTLTVAAPFPSAVRISFRSAHHSWTSMASWQMRSRQYAISVRLTPKVHATEQAQVVATVTPRSTGRSYQLFGQFWIRGLSAPMGMGMGMGH